MRFQPEIEVEHFFEHRFSPLEPKVALHYTRALSTGFHPLGDIQDQGLFIQTRLAMDRWFLFVCFLQILTGENISNDCSQFSSIMPINPKASQEAQRSPYKEARMDSTGSDMTLADLYYRPRQLLLVSRPTPTREIYAGLKPDQPSQRLVCRA